MGSERVMCCQRFVAFLQYSHMINALLQPDCSYSRGTGKWTKSAPKKKITERPTLPKSMFIFFIIKKKLCQILNHHLGCVGLSSASAGRNWDHRRGQRNWSTADCQRRCDSIGTGLAKNNASLRGAKIHTCTSTHEMSRNYPDRQHMLPLRGDA